MVEATRWWCRVGEHHEWRFLVEDNRELIRVLGQSSESSMRQ